ncbi:hypothetical protein EVA_04106 [gut metagenome]|uniref:Uncharacterized protein n=1 Tax=gut metagenome TaxID=749906 RepID=J9GKC6_9ZZZZ
MHKTPAIIVSLKLHRHNPIQHEPASRRNLRQFHPFP